MECMEITKAYRILLPPPTESTYFMFFIVLLGLFSFVGVITNCIFTRVLSSLSSRIDRTSYVLLMHNSFVYIIFCAGEFMRSFFTLATPTVLFGVTKLTCHWHMAVIVVLAQVSFISNIIFGGDRIRMSARIAEISDNIPSNSLNKGALGVLGAFYLFLMYQSVYNPIAVMQATNTSDDCVAYCTRSRAIPLFTANNWIDNIGLTHMYTVVQILFVLSFVYVKRRNVKTLADYADHRGSLDFDRRIMLSRSVELTKMVHASLYLFVPCRIFVTSWFLFGFNNFIFTESTPVLYKILVFIVVGDGFNVILYAFTPLIYLYCNKTFWFKAVEIFGRSAKVTPEQAPTDNTYSAKVIGIQAVRKNIENEEQLRHNQLSSLWSVKPQN